METFHAGALEVVDYHVEDGVAVVRLNRPERLNTINADMHRDLIACWDEVNRDPNVRAAVVTGTGRYFCAGRDIKEYLATREQGRLPPREDPESPLFGLSATNYRITKPLVAALNGPAAGGGVSLMLLSQMVVMADDAYIVDAHAKINGRPVLWLLPFLPINIAIEVMATDRRLTPNECLTYGLVNRVVSPANVLPAAIDLARRVTAMGPDAVRRMKDASLAIQDGMEMLVDREQIERLRHADPATLAAHNFSASRLEGMQAFVEKRA